MSKFTIITVSMVLFVTIIAMNMFLAINAQCTYDAVNNKCVNHWCSGLGCILQGTECSCVFKRQSDHLGNLLKKP
ncbi:hypothetical protein niasHT_023939 [Heterodera trifolii]|uniref:Late nodulin n=1 Tax=Heterodera trifolii TaxID=157864 RepID=A0ABD2JVD9_9BILA